MSSPTEITARQLATRIGTPDAPRLIDICIPEDVAAGPVRIPGAIRLPHSEITAQLPALRGHPVVVICQKGAKLSQGVAAILRSHGIKAETLAGGMQGWHDAALPILPEARFPGPDLWVTRHRPKIDRIACPWLIRRWIDHDARFLFVAPDAVMDVADRFGATPFDVTGAALCDGAQGCTFEALLNHYQLDHPPLRHMARIIRAADSGALAAEPEAAGLLALSLGLSRQYRDDLEQLVAGLPLYDALYRWARDATGEDHSHATKDAA